MSDKKLILKVDVTHKNVIYNITIDSKGGNIGYDYLSTVSP